MPPLTPADLRLWLLGPPQITLAGHAVTGFVSTKVQALLFYLALTGRAQARPTLADLFWPEMAEGAAQASLRKALSNLRQLLPDYLAIDRQQVSLAAGIAPWVDALALEAEVRARLAANNPETPPEPAELAQLDQVLSHYRGDFLEGFFLRQAPEFETWLMTQRAYYRSLAVSGLQMLVYAYYRQDEPARSCHYARRLLKLEPWHEETHCLLMEQLARMGQRSAALAQFGVCRQVLADELGVEPGPETLALLEQIKRGVNGAAPPFRFRSSPAPTPAGPSPANDTPGAASGELAPYRALPPQTIAFVGREVELTLILRRLRDPACRLLTLVGPGGIGKSRLAIQAMQRLLKADDTALAFPDGVAFVQLAPVETASGMISAIADALHFHFYRDLPPRRQLLDFLHERRLLLVLDNVEHLWAGHELIAEMLAHAPGVKLLVTSRQALKLREAWFLPIDGLSYPPPEMDQESLPASSVPAGVDPLPDTDPILAYDAVRLLVQHIRRVRPDFSLAAERRQAARVCRLVEGMPLGIELAAAWWHVISGDQIADQIEQGLDILTSRHQDTSERHHSMRAVLAHSWRLLSASERTVFMKLSVFRGSFGLEAATAVAGATVVTLASLIDRSLLRMQPSGRYQLHELLRQFAAEQLAANPAQRENAQARHGAYYLRFLQERDAALQDERQQRALAELHPEMENIRAAWEWAVSRRSLAFVHQAAESLFVCYWLQSRYQEGLESFRLAVGQLQGSLPPDDSTLALVQARAGAFYAALGHTQDASRLLKQSLMTARHRQDHQAAAFCLAYLSEVADWRDPQATPSRFLEESLALSRELGDQKGAAVALFRLSEHATYLGDYPKAQRLAQESLALCRLLGRKDRIAYALDKLGFAEFCSGDYAQAARDYREGYALFRELGDRLGMALTLGGLGWTAWAMGAPQGEALAPLEESLTLCREIGHRAHTSSRLAILAHIANGYGLYDLAYRSGEQSMTLARRVGHPVYEAFALNEMADAARGQGRLAEARQFLLAALEIARDRGYQSHHLETLVIFAALLALGEQTTGAAAQAKPREALALLDVAVGHPATLHVVRERALRLRSQIQG
ncbi:MAG TPA: tetratricopeptide repeat protein, partial [Caldilineaceae bacterium]|nr:tetratricopeptide repeat protein [Caldilineaceae bacterium]